MAPKVDSRGTRDTAVGPGSLAEAAPKVDARGTRDASVRPADSAETAAKAAPRAAQDTAARPADPQATPAPAARPADPAETAAKAEPAKPTKRKPDGSLSRLAAYKAEVAELLGGDSAARRRRKNTTASGLPAPDPATQEPPIKLTRPPRKGGSRAKDDQA